MPEKKTLAQFIYDLLSANHLKEGYGRGIFDATHGITFRSGSYSLRPLNYVVNFNRAATTYSEGYDIGYKDGLKVEHGIFPANSSSKSAGSNQSNAKGDTMATVQTSSTTISDVLKNVNTFKDDISTAKSRLENYMRGLYGSGEWKDDKLNIFVNTYLGPAFEKLKDIENALDDDARPWLEKLKDKIEDIENFQNSVSNDHP